MQKRYYIETFGCQMNVHDSEKMSGIMKKKGYEQTYEPKHADVVIFNTCSIRDKAEHKFFSRLGRLKDLKKYNPGLKIAVAGCVAQQRGEGIIKRAPYVDFVIGPQNLQLLHNIDTQDMHAVSCDDNSNIADSDLEADRQDKARAWVNVMYGCDNYCSYCIVPYTRGREISRPLTSILEEVRILSQAGVKEITFLGQNVNSYKSDTDFTGLLRATNEINGIERIRFVTSHPKDMSDELICAFRDLDKLCEHIHLPMQSGSTRILGLMNRKYSFSDYAARIARLRSMVPGIAITTDIIAGFPSETVADHQETLNALAEIRFDGIFAFKYSVRQGTAAAMLDGHLDEETKAERLNEIISLQNSITGEINMGLKNSIQEIMIDSVEQGASGLAIEGRTRTNKVVHCKAVSGSDISYSPGDLLSVKITRPARHSLQAIITEK